MKPLEGQVALITGGARGQGRSHAVHLASLGADIALVDSLKAPSTTAYAAPDRADLEETIRLVEKEGRRAFARQVDVRDVPGLTGFVADVVAELGRVDILIANAGMLSTSEISAMSPEVWAEMIDINLTGVFNSFRAVLPHMIASEYGRIVAISSAAGHMGFAQLGHYTAAKWGVIGLAKATALEVAQKGITVNVITPTNVNTAMIRNPAVEEMFLPGVANPTEEQVREAFVHNPMGVPWVESIDISRAVAFLVSPDSKYITGETIGPLAGMAATNGAA
ncbi:mycofactocin-coupled SDR family oxidoreductase [Gordonia sp. LSe1-13]|uniref:3-oxoacyl-[acyl-carrier-protein] reductase MabA n=1 Tax=Gordonia sesuvii TaxID=3116777 RepID=A0ABU7MIR6_9ACTN|nr:mycofactocin-coupled SDR family oxidoreductase [Gordonia sp. LSe1-13]